MESIKNSVNIVLSLNVKSILINYPTNKMVQNHNWCVIQTVKLTFFQDFIPKTSDFEV